MRSFFLKFTGILFILASCTASKKIENPGSQTIDNIRNHIQYLADDKLEGRRTGTTGEKLAMEYISGQFKTIGLKPMGTDNYYQPFDVNDGKQLNTGSFLSINGKNLELIKEFFIFPFSPNGQVQASPAIALKEADAPWFLDLKETLEENKSNSNFDLADFIRKTAQQFRDKGATAVIYYNTSELEDKLAFNPKDRTGEMPVPVVYVTKETAVKYFTDKSATVKLNLVTDIGEKKRVGHNVVGFIDNGAAMTIVLGAHFDHLGYGEDGNSMLRTGEHLIHNGADDNASGTAALIELARMLIASKAKNKNYLFIAFSGEELGLFGSKYYTEHPAIELSKTECMINMDMVGRLNDSTHVITIGGYGTSPAWGEYFSMQQVSGQGFVFKYDSSGTGPSDHSSFYRKDIPVLFYFTGLHQDYHKPSDDADKINYTGEVKIIKHIYGLVEALNNKDKLAFAKTRETTTSTSARSGVTMGIMPDYTFAGTGLRADGISDGRPAQKAGLKAGDIIIQLGNFPVSSMDSYMQALGKFKKGEKTIVKFKRGNDIMEVTVEF